MEVIAIADRNDHWRWEIRHQGKIITESRGTFAGGGSRGSPETDEPVTPHGPLARRLATSPP
jgi:hypothetical protein